MNVLRAIAVGILVSTLSCMPAIAQIPATAGTGDMQMTAASRQQLIDQLIQEVNGKYVFPDLAKKAEAVIRTQHKRGAYDGMVGAQQFCEALTRELQATTKDRHLRVTFSQNAIPANKSDSVPAPEDIASRLAMLRSSNFGVRKVEQLPFNIGYLELTGFVPAKDAADTLAAAMTVLAHTDALIIDLRNNLGGDASGVTLLASYLFDKRTRLNDFYYREGNRLEQRWSSDVVPGLRYGQGRDVVILTSKETFSAAEEFTYALKNLGRATVIGETTGGGANPGSDIRLSPHFSVFVPLGRSVSPVTRSNWEGTGVAPDIGVPSGDALRKAQLVILTKMAQSEKNAVTLGYLKERIAEIDNQRTGDAGSR